MKLIVQIPCYNEEATLPLVINTIPKFIPGIDKVETLIVDDGSSDKTIKVARKLGVNYIVKHRKNKGLAASFADGIDEALRQGADIIVNTDGDNQYPQQDIPKLIQPIVDGTHDIVVADRQTDKIAHFSPFKKFMQRFGSHVVNLFYPGLGLIHAMLQCLLM
jgi:glycosyltransferase involved in cell wall biosynthesis